MTYLNGKLSCNICHVGFFELHQESDQINFIYIAQNQNHIASVGFTICTVNDLLCP